MRWLLPLIVATAVFSSPAPAPAQEVDVQGFLDAAEPSLGGTITEVARLSGAEALPDGSVLTSRSVHHQDLPIAEDYVIGVLEALPAMQVWTEPFEGADVIEGAQVPVNGVRNIVAQLDGADPDLPILVVGAHLDSTASAEDDWIPQLDPAPGADDDASGVAVVMALARACARWEGGLRRTVRFVLFTAEEIGLQGSFAHVDALDPGEELHLMLQLDPVGFNGADGNRLWFAWDPRWPDSLDLVGDAAAASGSYLTVQGVDRTLLGSQAERSDHFPFWEAGVRAIHFGAFPPPPDYHKTTDTLEGVDPAFLDEVTSVLLQLVATEAEPLAVVDVTEGSGCACEASLTSATPSSWASWGVGLVVLLAPRRRRKR
ncbi:MAG: Zn-dependent exopeptidase M28 [Deltaproteobacteria bacterium]|nr:Zn-dependent exopeptidase M28 [Deltaproteobacteria bacterium]